MDVDNLTKFSAERAAIVDALAQTTGIEQVMFNKDDVPKNLPAAIVILESETGTKGTSKRFCDTDISWTVYLIVNAHKVDDPDTALYTLKETFREKYMAETGRDIPGVEYYSSRADASRLVRVAKLSLMRSGSGAGA